MKKLALAFAPLALLPGTLFAAAGTQHVMLHVAARYMHNMHFAHVMGNATLRHKGMDININVTTDGLPKPSTVGATSYVLWAQNGSKWENLGTLRLSGNMAGLKATTMWHTVQDLDITAEKSAGMSAPHGPVVLSAMVM